MTDECAFDQANQFLGRPRVVPQARMAIPGGTIAIMDGKATCVPLRFAQRDRDDRCPCPIATIWQRTCRSCLQTPRQTDRFRYPG